MEDSGQEHWLRQRLPVSLILREDDVLIEVNGVNVERIKHLDVVSRIRWAVSLGLSNELKFLIQGITKSSLFAGHRQKDQQQEEKEIF